jgi:hypothetical protein
MDSLKVQESFQRRRTGGALNRKKSGAALREMVAKRNARGDVSDRIKREITHFKMPGLRGGTGTVGRAFLIRAGWFCVAGG